MLLWGWSTPRVHSLWQGGEKSEYFSRRNGKQQCHHWHRCLHTLLSHSLRTVVTAAPGGCGGSLDRGSVICQCGPCASLDPKTSTELHNSEAALGTRETEQGEEENGWRNMSAFGSGLLLWGKTKLQPTSSGHSLKNLNNGGPEVGVWAASCQQNHGSFTLGRTSPAVLPPSHSPSAALLFTSVQKMTEKIKYPSAVTFSPSSVGCKPLTEQRHLFPLGKNPAPSVASWIQSCIWPSQQILQFKLWPLRVQHLWKFRPSSQASAKEVTHGYGTALAEAGAWPNVCTSKENCWCSQRCSQRIESILCISLCPLPLQEQLSTNLLLLFFEKHQHWNAACEYPANLKPGLQRGEKCWSVQP